MVALSGEADPPQRPTAAEVLDYLVDTLEPLALMALRAGAPLAALRLLEARVALQEAQKAAPGDAA